jgi:hypothetical protein
MTSGVPGAQLSAEELDRELRHLHEKRHDIFVGGTADQWRNHVARTAELEQAYAARFADRMTDPGAKGTS